MGAHMLLRPPSRPPPLPPPPIAALLQEVDITDASSVQLLADWPLLPTTRGHLLSCSFLPAAVCVWDGASRPTLVQRLQAGSEGVQSAWEEEVRQQQEGRGSNTTK